MTDPVGFPPIREDPLPPPLLPPLPPDHMPTVAVAPPERRRSTRSGTRRHRAGGTTAGQYVFRIAAVLAVLLIFAGPTYALIYMWPSPASHQVPAAVPLGPETAPLTTEPSSPPTTLPPTRSKTKPTTPQTPYYRSCTQLLAVGPPLERGEPGYRIGLDPDEDGVACES